jgi:thymidine phosphorylase
MADEILSDGRALKKLIRICEAQGGFREPPVADLRHEFGATATGTIIAIDNRLLARIAKLAGAPAAMAAGLELHVKTGDRVQRGQPLITLHAETRGEMAYALAFARANPHAIAVAEP